MERSSRSTTRPTPQYLNRARVQPQVLADADAASAWYEKQRQGLEVEFILELDAAIERATESPAAYARQYREMRRI